MCGYCNRVSCVHLPRMLITRHVPDAGFMAGSKRKLKITLRQGRKGKKEERTVSCKKRVCTVVSSRDVPKCVIRTGGRQNLTGTEV